VSDTINGHTCIFRVTHKSNAISRIHSEKQVYATKIFDEGIPNFNPILKQNFKKPCLRRVFFCYPSNSWALFMLHILCYCKDDYLIPPLLIMHLQVGNGPWELHKTKRKKC